MHTTSIISHINFFKVQFLKILNLRQQLKYNFLKKDKKAVFTPPIKKTLQIKNSSVDKYICLNHISCLFSTNTIIFLLQFNDAMGLRCPKCWQLGQLPFISLMRCGDNCLSGERTSHIFHLSSSFLNFPSKLSF